MPDIEVLTLPARHEAVAVVKSLIHIHAIQDYVADLRFSLPYYIEKRRIDAGASIRS